MRVLACVVRVCLHVILTCQIGFTVRPSNLHRVAQPRVKCDETMCVHARTLLGTQKHLNIPALSYGMKAFARGHMTGTKQLQPRCVKVGERAGKDHVRAALGLHPVWQRGVWLHACT